MITSPIKRRRAAWAALLLAGASVPALGQGQDTPESLLPPGFDDPAPAPAPAPAPGATSAPDTTPGFTTTVPVPDGALSNVADAEEEDGEQPPIDLTKYELPDFAKHSLGRIGVSAAGNAPFPANSLGGADGRYLMTLMQRLEAPIASRWASIALRRALMSRLDTPAGVNGADFAAERAWLLLRMGEAVAARAVVSDVDTDNYTRRLFQVSMQTSLANGDPAGLCPVADRAASVDTERGWALALAICAGLAGKPSEAGQLLSQARQGTRSSDFDNLLAEKVLGTGAQGRRAVTIEWNGVDSLTAWRWGLATATGVEVPAELYQGAGAQVRYWQALSSNIDPAARASAAELAATAGVFSNAGLVDLYSEIDQQGEAGTPQSRTARDLRTAYTDADVSERLEAIQVLWNAGSTPRARYARLILTARAASWIPASAEIAAPEQLIASMLSAGMDTPAMEWRSVATRGSEAWALLALADPALSRVAIGDFDTFADEIGGRKAKMLLAGLAGLGKLAAGEAQRAAAAVDVQIAGANAWTRAIDEAGVRGDAALVALLAGIGMQTSSWERVTPEALFHVVAAMRAAGMADYARMIAVEAVTRS